MTEGIPLKCVFGDHNFLNIFDTDAITSSTNESSTTNSLHFGVIKFKSHKIDKDCWILDLKNIQLKGMDEAILDKFSFNFVTNIFKITFHTDLFVTYDYKTYGCLFSMPIFGEGLLTAHLESTVINMSMPFDFKEINGKKFIKLRDFDLLYDMTKNPVFNFSNLYNGDKKLSDSMHSLIKENFGYFSLNFGMEFMDKFGEQVFNVIRNYIQANTLRDC
ncbi:unnamed protein product [Euphydryas editha]|uniref:Uncharacterized protein n=1 Tax=Euphydryas editha TaxID=104508 RepID=A0AAU9V112_EUPED|nr:unnamed protein product [Euphydryas editha]